MRRRIAIVVCLVAGLLYPSLNAPARTVRVPKVLARSTTATLSEEATFAFPATHVVVSWKGHDGLKLRLRIVGPDGTRGGWFVAEEAHDLVKGRRHYTGVLAVDRAVRLEWIPRAKRGKPVGRVRIFYMNTSDGPIIERTVPATAEAQSSTPDVVTRAEWGADESLKSTSGGCDRDFYPLQQLFVHHTAGSESGPYYDDDMRAHYKFHTAPVSQGGRGWCDLGYNFVIAPDGTIFEGRWARNYSDWEVHNSEDRSSNVVAGAHVANYNSGSLGISMMGNFTSAKLTAAARASLIDALAWIADRHDLDPTAKHTYVNPATGDKLKLPVIAGHRDAGQTACPGDTVYKSLPALRQDVALRIGSGKSATFTTLLSTPGKIDYGDAVTLSGTLTSDGFGLAGRTVLVYAKAGPGPWTSFAELTTSSDGSFGLTATPQRNTRYEARFSGDGLLWDSASDRRSAKVRPELSLTTDDGTGSEAEPVPVAAGGRVSLGGDMAPALDGQKLKIKIFKQRNNGTEVLVREKRVATSAGEYLTTYRPKKPGKTYRAVTWFPKGSGFAATRSNLVFFSVGSG